jgi:hypothetical protein
MGDREGSARGASGAPGVNPKKSGEAPPALVGVPLLARTVPGPSSPGCVHRRHLRGRCRCVSRGMCRTSLGDAFGRERKLSKGGGRHFSPGDPVTPVPAPRPTLC